MECVIVMVESCEAQIETLLRHEEPPFRGLFVGLACSKPNMSKYALTSPL